jgi:hypothetical protein
MKLIFSLFALVFCVATFAETRSVEQQFSEIKNLLKNPGFENGKADWTASAGTFTITSTAANVGQGARAGSWDGSATGQTLTSTAVTLTAGYYAQNCLAKVLYKSAESTVPYVLEALDGSNNVLGSQTLNAASTFTRAEASFICPSTGSVKLRVRTSSTSGDPAVIYLDAAYIGLNYLITNLTESKHFGGATWAATSSCSWGTTSNSYGNFSADSDCTSPSSTNLQGNALAPSTKVPGIRFSSLPPGRYMVVATGDFNRANVSTSVRWRFSDGTNTSPDIWWNVGSATAINMGQLVGWFNYTAAQGDTTIQVQARNGDGTTSVSVTADTIPFDIQVYHFPSVAQQAVSVDQAGWRIDASISGANPSLGTSAVTSYTGIENGSLTLTQNSGSATAWIPCSSTNDSSGTTCSAGSESIGVSFTIPYAGEYLACIEFGHEVSLGVTGVVEGAFQVVETPNAAQTISQEGKNRAAWRFGSASSNQRYSHRTCGTFSFSSVGRKTVRLMYEQAVTATVNGSQIIADADSNNGQRDIHVEVYPVSRAWPLPIVVGGVSSNTTGQERVERVQIASDGTTINTQSGSWVSSSSKTGTGNYALTLAAGIFAAAPVCVCGAYQADLYCRISGTTTATSVELFLKAPSTGTATDAIVNIICMGRK